MCARVRLRAGAALGCAGRELRVGLLHPANVLQTGNTPSGGRNKIPGIILYNTTRRAATNAYTIEWLASRPFEAGNEHDSSMMAAV